MIKINKDISATPKSLIPAFRDLFPAEEKIPRLSDNTHEKRMQIINNGSFIDAREFRDRYKKTDIIESLKAIYKNKCAYCEQKIEQFHVEHYRPKKIYYWLAFSWDNLIVACPTCNQSKGDNFDLDGELVEFNYSEDTIRHINSISHLYDLLEQPKMVNPEITDPLENIEFSIDGSIFSFNSRFSYTIEKCSLNRIFLKDERRKILDDFERDIQSILIEKKDSESQKAMITAIVRKFIRDSKDTEKEFLAFRNFSILSNWINDIIKKLN